MAFSYLLSFFSHACVQEVRTSIHVRLVLPHCFEVRCFSAVFFPFVWYTHANTMTEYNFPHTIVPSNEVQERKEERKKLLEAIYQQQREHYKHFMEKKRRLQAAGEMI